MIHFLHTADWQIGRQYGQFNTEDAAFMTQARLSTVAAIAAQAAERKVDAVLVAGDVFDAQNVSERTLRRLFDALHAYAGAWIMISGNHDAAVAHSVWSRARELGCIPENVLLPGPGEVVRFAQGRAAVLAAPLVQRQTFDDTTEIFDTLQTPPGTVRIGLAHGSVTGRLPEGIDSSNPVAADRAARARLDYLALGDWHGMLEIDARTWYSGTPEPDRFRNNKAGYILDVRIAQAGDPPIVAPVEVGAFRWQDMQRTLSLPSDVDALVHELTNLASSDVVRLGLSGSLALDDWQRLQQAFGRCTARVHTLRVDSAALDLYAGDAELAEVGVDGYVAEVAAELQAMQQDSERAQVARTALRLLLQFQRDKPVSRGRQA